MLVAVSATLTVAAACSTFGADGPAPAPDGGPEAAPSEGGSGPCLPVATPDASRSCAGDCVPKLFFPKTPVAAAVVRKGSVWVVSSDGVLTTNPIDTGTLQPLGGGSVQEVTHAISVDDKHVYVSTNAEEARFPIAGGPKEKLPLVPIRGPVVLGDTMIFQIEQLAIVSAPKDNKTPATLLEVQRTFLGAVEGDRLYWVGSTNAAEKVVLGPHTGPLQHGSVITGDVIAGFLVNRGFAYLAEVAKPPAIGSTVSRIALDANKEGAHVVVANEPGTIDGLYIDGDNLYWKSKRGALEGGRVLVRAGVCGGDPVVLATELDPMGPLSFDDKHAYAAKLPAGAVPVPLGVVQMNK